MPSSVIHRFRYDQDRRELAITFVSGKVYVYRDVPEAVAQELTAAPSRGQFFNKNIRDCYAYAEVVQPIPARSEVRQPRTPTRKAQQRANSR